MNQRSGRHEGNRIMSTGQYKYRSLSNPIAKNLAGLVKPPRQYTNPTSSISPSQFLHSIPFSRKIVEKAVILTRRHEGQTYVRLVWLVPTISFSLAGRTGLALPAMPFGTERASQDLCVLEFTIHEPRGLGWAYGARSCFRSSHQSHDRLEAIPWSPYQASHNFSCHGP